VATTAVSATVLLVEITLTRFFSLFLHHHYVFVALAVALLGLGLGATLCAATGHRWEQGPQHVPTRRLWHVCAGTGVLLMVVTVLFTQTALASVWPTAAVLALLPFLGAGWFLALVFTVDATRSRELYAADLLGAGAGCLVSLPALQWLGAEDTLALAALVLLVVAALLALTRDQRGGPVPVCLCLLCGGMVGVAMAADLLTIRPLALLRGNKHLSRILDTDPQARIVETRWSTLARTDVVAFSHQGKHQYAAFTDGGAATMLMPLPATPAEMARLDRDAGLLPYRTPPQERVLIIGAGGGLDVVLALYGGAQDITAVEINPDILRAVERFVPPARNVYRSPKVRVVRGDGRQVVRRSVQVYDLIVLQQVYTGAAQRQGGTLVENYVLTTEAFQDYLAHLAPHGRVVVQVHDVIEVLKTVLMGVEALARSGNTGPAVLDHVLIFQAAAEVQEALLPIHAPVMMLKKTPYTLAESQQQITLLQTMQLTPLFVPHIAATSPLADLLQKMLPFFSQSGGPGSPGCRQRTIGRSFTRRARMRHVSPGPFSQLWCSSSACISGTPPARETLMQPHPRRRPGCRSLPSLVAPPCWRRSPCCSSTCWWWAPPP
jgi:spermidine synthase